LTAESQSRSETPSVETPSASIAPWASNEPSKGPSLKEIQAAEAKKAAEREKVEAAARRAQMEKELLAQANALTTAPALGLPNSATWGSGASPSTPTANTASAWAKPVVGKAPTAGSSGKTLAQIQREEEARKLRAVAAAKAASTVSGTPVSMSAAGKTYAGLAGNKAAPTTPSATGVGGAWTTVGSSGKVKTPTVTIPTAPSAPAPTGSAGGVRSTSGNVAPATMASKVKPTSATPSRSGTMNVGAAQEEFKKWAVGELMGDLKKGISGMSFCSLLVSLIRLVLY